MAGIVCEKCSKEVRQEKRGSLTQWIFDDTSCACQQSVLSEPSTSDRTVCPKCFNFKASRSGSITQWIFRRYQCKCNPDSETVEAEIASPEDGSSSDSVGGEPEPEEDFGTSEMPFSVERTSLCDASPETQLACSTNALTDN